MGMKLLSLQSHPNVALEDSTAVSVGMEQARTLHGTDIPIETIKQSYLFDGSYCGAFHEESSNV